MQGNGKATTIVIAFSMFTVLILTSTLTAVEAVSPHIQSLSSPTDIIFASWLESGEKILAKRSIDGGSTFSNNIDFSNDAGCCSGPASASFQNNVYVVWSSDDFSSHLIGSSEVL